jgi:hypothetical protein
MAPIPISVVAGELARAIVFWLILDGVKIPVSLIVFKSRTETSEEQRVEFNLARKTEPAQDQLQQTALNPFRRLLPMTVLRQLRSDAVSECHKPILRR